MAILPVMFILVWWSINISELMPAKMLCTSELIALYYCIAFLFLWKVELNEIESRCEEYPLTRAFCQLISTLVESSFPSNLGAGLRPPGFDPYLQFLRDSVFLRFRTRAYRRAAEKVMFLKVRKTFFSLFIYLFALLLKV